MRNKLTWINTLLIVGLYLIVIRVLLNLNYIVLPLNFLSDASWIENLYYGAGIISIVAILIAVLSYRTNKNYEDDKRQREIAVQTIQLCNDYIEHTLPKIDSIEMEIKGLGYRNDYLNISKELEAKVSEVVKSLEESKFAEYMLLLNKLESISFYFEKGYFSVSIAKEILGDIFYDDVCKFGYLIIYERISNKNAFNDLIVFHSKLRKSN